MTKEQQKESAQRIMAKLGPLTPIEQRIYAMLTTEPEQYPKADRDFRVCQECGQDFKTLDRVGQEQLTAMQQFADHQAIHNPQAGQWVEAHKRIRAGLVKPATP